MRKGAMVFQLVRNTTAIWRNAARYCWFKMDLFVSKLYVKPARERRSRDVRRHAREGQFCFHSPPPRSPSGPASYAPGGRPCRGSGALEGQPRPGRRDAVPERAGGQQTARGQGDAHQAGRGALGSALEATLGVQLGGEDTRILTPSWLHPCLLHAKGHLRVLVAQ